MGKLYLLSMLATLLAFAASASVSSSNLEAVDKTKMSTFTKIGEKYYAIEAAEKLTWFGAAHFCRRMDAQLATFETEKEWQELSTYLLSAGYTDQHWFWLAANNLDTLKDYYWLSTGQPMHFSKWSTGQPDNYDGTENCAHFWQKDGVFLMNDRICSAKAYFICEAASPKTISITIW